MTAALEWVCEFAPKLGGWVVEAVDDHGECYITQFYGLLAEDRAKAYAAWMSELNVAPQRDAYAEQKDEALRKQIAAIDAWAMTTNPGDASKTLLEVGHLARAALAKDCQPYAADKVVNNGPLTVPLDALRELVRLKGIKEALEREMATGVVLSDHGIALKHEYESRKDRAWAAARAAFNNDACEERSSLDLRFIEAGRAVVRGWQGNMTVIEEFEPLIRELALASQSDLPAPIEASTEKR